MRGIAELGAKEKNNRGTSKKDVRSVGGYHHQSRERKAILRSKSEN
ncbi:MAG: hypothetical protein ACTSQP_19900 [Promethearchaeota archaeon]